MQKDQRGRGRSAGDRHRAMNGSKSERDQSGIIYSNMYFRTYQNEHTQT